MTRAALLLLAALAALHLPWGSPPVSIYREIVCATPFDLPSLASRFPALDRPYPFTPYTTERE